MMAAAAASKGLETIQGMATQRVIGYTKSVTTRKGKKNPKLVQENLNIGIQAWEIGILVASIAVFDYVEGSGAFGQSLQSILTTPTVNPSDSSGSPRKISLIPFP